MRRRLSALLALLPATLVITQVLTLSNASAWQYDGYYGSPGSVLTTTQIEVHDSNWASLVFLNANGPTVSRSPATAGDQEVTIYYNLSRWTGSEWAVIQRTGHTSTLPAGSDQVQLKNMYIAPDAALGYFRVTEAFVWYVGGTNTFLGATAILPTNAEDMVCITTLRACTAYPGYLDVGAR